MKNNFQPFSSRILFSVTPQTEARQLEIILQLPGSLKAGMSLNHMGYQCYQCCVSPISPA